MARPMKPLPADAGPLVDFARDLRTLRREAGNPTLQRMAQQCGISTASLSKAQSGTHRPSWESVHGYVRACGGCPEDWSPRWHRLRLENTPSAEGRSDAALFRSCLQRWADTGKITPPRIRNAEQLRGVLRTLLQFYGLSLRSLAAQAPGYSHSSYGAMLCGTRALTPAMLQAFLSGCGVRSHASLEEWFKTLARVEPDIAFDAYGTLQQQRIQLQTGVHNTQPVRLALDRLLSAIKGRDSRIGLNSHTALTDGQAVAESRRKLLLALQNAMLRVYGGGPLPVELPPGVLARCLRGESAMPASFLSTFVLLALPNEQHLQAQVHDALRRSNAAMASDSKIQRLEGIGQLTLTAAAVEASA